MIESHGNVLVTLVFITIQPGRTGGDFSRYIGNLVAITMESDMTAVTVQPVDTQLLVPLQLPCMVCQMIRRICAATRATNAAVGALAFLQLLV